MSDLNKSAIHPVYIRLELSDEYLSNDHKRLLMRYGQCFEGGSIIRDVLIPSDMPLHNLHYAIQKMFGWTNSHLRSFYLPDEIYDALISKSVKGWSELVGIVFQSPSEGEQDIFWDEDYRKGSISTWLKKKYTGPYQYGGYYEHYENAQKDIQEVLNHFPLVEVRESMLDYLKRMETSEDESIKVLRKAPLIDLTMDEFNNSVGLETSTNSLMERLELDKVLASKNGQLKQDGVFPLTTELIYNYDFGDDWTVKITKFEDCSSLIKENKITPQELEEAIKTLLSKHKPVCINREGLSVLDDVGNLHGYADFLETIFESTDKKNVSEMKAWAKYQGWTGKTLAPKDIL